MSQYALINDNVVENVILADDKYVEHVKDRYQAIVAVGPKDLVNIGDPYDPATGKIRKVEVKQVDEPEDLLTNISAVDFRERFTLEELAAIYKEAEGNSSVKLFVDELTAYDVLGSVDLTNPRLTQLLDLIPNEILSDIRKEEIASL